MIRAYVDGLIIIGTNHDLIRAFKEEMMTLSHMTNLGLLFSYFSIEVI